MRRLRHSSHHIRCARYGGADYYYNVCDAIANDEVHPDVRCAISLNLRSLCVYKSDGVGHRPLGLPEAEARFFFGACASQENPRWNEFYTRAPSAPST